MPPSQARLLQCADVAMYAAKKGAGPVQLYDRDKDQNTLRHLTLSGALRQAIEGGELSLEFQPKLDLLAGTMRSVEALARWCHPVQGAILPDEFIPHAEQTGLIQPFTRWTFDAALAQLALWQDAGIGISVAVNLSARSLHDEMLPDIVATLLRKWRVDPDPAHARAHRERGDARSRGRAAQPVPPARARRAAVDRRLRHRLFLALGAAAPAAARDQDRQVVRRPRWSTTTTIS